MNTKQLIVDLFQKDLDRDFILSIKDVDIDNITTEVLMFHDPIDLNSFIW